MNAMPVMQLMIRGGTDGNLRSYVNDEIIPELEKISFEIVEFAIYDGRPPLNYAAFERAFKD